MKWVQLWGSLDFLQWTLGCGLSSSWHIFLFVFYLWHFLTVGEFWFLSFCIACSSYLPCWWEGRDLIFFINYGVLRTKKYLVGFTDIEKRLVVAKEKGGGEGWLGSLGLASRYKLLYVEWITTRSYCIALGTIFNILW